MSGASGRGSGGVQLGYADREPGSKVASIGLPRYSDWDGGKLGGRPYWLTLEGLDSQPPLLCGVCGKCMVLLVQIYAPLDDEECGHEDAFHRTLYVFCCPHSACVNMSGGGGGAVVVVRSQLPRVNTLYPYNGDEPIVAPLWGATHAASLCVLCGIPAPSRCARCKGPKYCTRAHQLAHWRLGHKERCCPPSEGSSSSTSSTSGSGGVEDKDTLLAIQCGAILPEWEVKIEEEPSVEERAEHAESTLPPQARKAVRAMKAAVGLGGGATGSGEKEKEEGEGEGETTTSSSSEKDPSINTLTQQELNDATGSKAGVDTSLIEFEVRVACAQDQVLRYSGWWPEPPPDIEQDRAMDDEGVKEGGGGGGGKGGLAAAATAVVVGKGKSGGGGGEKAEKEKEGGGEEEEEGDGPVELEEIGVGEGPGVPLWFSSSHQPSGGDIPPCPLCHTPRVFEFQVMPQALHYVLGGADGGQGEPQDTGSVTLDFGTIAVYTCPKACPLLPGRRFEREAVWVQASGAMEPEKKGE